MHYDHYSVLRAGIVSPLTNIRVNYRQKRRKEEERRINGRNKYLLKERKRKEGLKEGLTEGREEGMITNIYKKKGRGRKN